MTSTDRAALAAEFRQLADRYGISRSMLRMIEIVNTLEALATPPLPSDAPSPLPVQDAVPESPLFLAARAVCCHWVEFGPEYGFAEVLDGLYSVLYPAPPSDQPVRPADAVPRPSGDELRLIAQEARNQNGPSDVTSPTQYVLQGWLARDAAAVQQADKFIQCQSCGHMNPVAVQQADLSPVRPSRIVPVAPTDAMKTAGAPMCQHSRDLAHACWERMLAAAPLAAEISAARAEVAAWPADLQAAANRTASISFPMADPVAQQVAATPENHLQRWTRVINAAWPAEGHSPIEVAIDAYLEDYELRGEDEDGRDACHTPSEAERGVIKDAIIGLLSDDGFVRATALRTPAAGGPAPLTEGDIDAVFWAVAKTNTYGVPHLSTYREGFTHIVRAIESRITRPSADAKGGE